MTAQSALLICTVVVLGLLLWQLRWVLLVLFGAVVLSVALDVLIQQLQKRLRIDRPQALVVVLATLMLASLLIGQLLLPELITQVQQLGRDLPQLISTLTGLLDQQPRLAALNQAVNPGLTAENLQSLGRQLVGVAGERPIRSCRCCSRCCWAFFWHWTRRPIDAWCWPSHRVEHGSGCRICWMKAVRPWVAGSAA